MRTNYERNITMDRHAQLFADIAIVIFVLIALTIIFQIGRLLVIKIQDGAAKRREARRARNRAAKQTAANDRMWNMLNKQ